MISCKKATELVSKSMEEKLGIREVISLRLHFYVCAACVQFKKQVELLRAALTSREGDSKSASNLPGLSPEAKASLKISLKARLYGKNGR